MIRRLLLTAIFILGFTGSAAARSEAFISLRDTDDGSWGRDSRLQEVFHKKLGYDSADLNNDATPSELAVKLEKFLIRKGNPGDRRFVWINSLQQGPDSACPRNPGFAIRPVVPTLILAPACFAEYLEPRAEALHISLRDLPLSRPRQMNETKHLTAPLVFIALPSDNSKIMSDATKLILDTLHKSADGYVSPATILRRLRYELRTDGSNYTPSLDASPAAAAWSRRFLTPARGAIGGSSDPASLGGPTFEARLGWPRGTAFGLYTEPQRGTAPSLWLAGRTPVTVIRRSRDGGMGFVKTAEDLFGWVRLDDLD